MSDSEYIDLHSIRVVLAKLPGNVKAFSVPNMDSYTVVINSDLPHTEQLDAVHHEINHIRQGDHHNLDYQEYV